MKNLSLALLAAALFSTSEAFVSPSLRVRSSRRADLVSMHMKKTDLEAYVSSTMESSATKEPKALSKSSTYLGAFALLLLTGVSWVLQGNLNEACIASGPEICGDAMFEQSKFFQDHPVGSFVLMFTHAFPFALIPVTMKFVNDKADIIQEKHPSFNPFAMQLGLATICFALAFEFGWHVTTAWYYANDFHVLNFIFYFFLISSFALWADGFESTFKMDALFGAILAVATVLYPIGAEKAMVDPTGGGEAKIPLYLGLTVTFASLTQRGWKVFGKPMGLVFLFSVVVNLAFIFLLQGLPQDELSIWNYVYHIAHDLLGTEAGVAIFAYLMATYDPAKLPLPAEESTD